MHKRTPNKALLIIGLTALIATPFTIIFLSPSIANALCTPQTIKGTEICIGNPVPAFLITLFVPIGIGTILLLVSVLRKK